MSNVISHFFGPYFEIEVKEQMLISGFVTLCENGHKASGKFCQECGGKAKDKQAVKKKRYPTEIFDYLLGDEEWEDTLTVITPPDLFATGVIIAIGNLTTDPTWFDLPEYGEGIQMKRFPTSDEVEGMKTELKTSYADIIQALRESDEVISVEIKAGYVLDMEY